MSNINQIQMSFVPLEDRLLFRLNTVDSSGFQFWLTRRYVKLLWPVLMDMLAKDQQVVVHSSEESKKEVLSFQQEQAVQKMDYSQTFKQALNSQPLGDAPILLSKISVNDRDDGTQLLSIRPDNGQGIELSMDQMLLQSLTKLIQDAVVKTDWDMDLSQSFSSKATPELEASRVLN